MRRLLTTLLLFAPLVARAQTSTKGIAYVNQSSNPCGAGTSCSYSNTSSTVTNVCIAPDGASAVALKVQSSSTWSNAAARLISLVNNVTEKAYFLATGDLFIGTLIDRVTAGTLSIAPTTANAIRLGQNTSLATGKTLTVQADVDSSGVGPIIASSTSNPTIGVAVTLDATSDAGGRKYSIISTGANAGVGAGALSIFDATAVAYRLVIDANGVTPPVAYTANSGTAARPWNEENLHHLVGHSTAKPSCAPDTGAGGGATCSTLAGSTDIAGTLEVVTGLAPAVTAIVATVTFYTAYNSAPRCVIWPANLAAQAMMANSPFVTSSPTMLAINSGAVAATATSTLQYTYHCVE